MRVVDAESRREQDLVQGVHVDAGTQGLAAPVTRERRRAAGGEHLRRRNDITVGYPNQEAKEDARLSRGCARIPGSSTCTQISRRKKRFAGIDEFFHRRRRRKEVGGEVLGLPGLN
jgi:hypothetical protein